jgi:hypothetical protein
VALPIPGSAARSQHLFAFAARTVFAPWFYPGAKENKRNEVRKGKGKARDDVPITDLVVNCELSVQ